MFRLQTVGGFGGKSDQLNAYNVFMGDPAYFDRDLERYQVVTAESLRQAVARYLDPATPRHAQHRAARSRRTGRPGLRRRRSFRDASTAGACRSQARPGAFAFPAIDKSTLANGLRVWTVHHTQVPIVAFMLLVRRGASSDPPGKDGLAAVTADMLDEGSGDRSAIEMHEALARLGAQFDTDIGSDATVASVTVLSRFADRALALLSDIVVRPALREDDFARVRQLRLHRLTQMRDMPGAVADRAFLKLLYGAHPYGHSPIGSEASLAAMHVDDVRGLSRTGDPAVGRDVDCGRRLRARRDRAPGRRTAFGGWTAGRRRRRAAGAGAAARPEAEHRAAAEGAAVRAAHRPGRRSAATRPTTTRWSSPTRFSAASSSAGST